MANALQPGGKPPVATNLNLVIIICIFIEHHTCLQKATEVLQSTVRNVQAQTPTAVAREVPLGGIRLVCCERLSQLVDLGLLFTAVAHK